MAVGMRELSEEGEGAEDGGGEPEEEDGQRGRAAGADESVREVVLVADVEGFAETPADVNHGDEVGEDDAEDEQRFEDGKGLHVGGGVEMGEDREEREEIADEVAAGIAEERGGPGEIEGEEAEERAGGEEPDGGDEVLAVAGGGPGEGPDADEAEAGAEAVHVIHEVGGIGEGNDPKDGDGVAEEGIVHEQGDANAGGGDGGGDEELSTELGEGAEFVFIVPEAERDHADGAEQEDQELEGAAVQAVAVEVQGEGFDEGRNRRLVASGMDEPKAEDRGGQGDEDTGEDGESTGEGDGSVMQFPMAGVVDEADAAGPGAPERESQGGDQRGREEREGVNVQGKAHGRGGRLSSSRR